MTPVEAERLTVASNAVERLLRGMKSKTLRGSALKRMKMIEKAMQCLELASLT